VTWFSAWESSELERVTLVNGGNATPERALHAGDVVIVFPPLAGGRR
jgi:molybdopterin converting factor small subunit